MIDVPTNRPEKFEGQITCTVSGKAPSDIIIFVIPQMSEVIKRRVKAAFAKTANTLRPLSENQNLENGRIYVIHWWGEYRRAWFLKYDGDDKKEVEMILFDIGQKVTVEKSEISSCPPEVASCDIFGAICPVFVPEAPEDFRAVVASMIGRECRCVPEAIVHVPGMMPCVTAEIYVEYRPGAYVSLKHIELTSTENDPPGIQNRRNLIRALQNFPGNFGNNGGRREQNNWSADGNNQRRGGRGRNFFGGRGFGRGNRGGFNNMPDSDFGAGGQLLEHAPPVATSCFKEYEPNYYPAIVRVRFDREDPESPRLQFWLLDPSTLAAVERVLDEGRERYNGLDPMSRVPLGAAIGEGCLVRITVGPGRTILRRAIVGGFSPQRNKYWVHLIDLGQFAWVRMFDMLEVSNLDKSDSIFTISVAMFRCRFLQPTSVRLQDLIRGVDYYVTLLSRGCDGIFFVQIAPSGMPGGIPLAPGSTLEQTRATNNMLQALNNGLLENLLQNLTAVEQKLNRSWPAGGLPAVEQNLNRSWPTGDLSAVEQNLNRNWPTGDLSAVEQNLNLNWPTGGLPAVEQNLNRNWPTGGLPAVEQNLNRSWPTGDLSAVEQNLNRNWPTGDLSAVEQNLNRNWPTGDLSAVEQNLNLNWPTGSLPAVEQNLNLNWPTGGLSAAEQNLNRNWPTGGLPAVEQNLNRNWPTGGLSAAEQNLNCNWPTGGLSSVEQNFNHNWPTGGLSSVEQNFDHNWPTGGQILHPDLSHTQTLWPQFPGIGVPYVAPMPTAVPVPIPAANTTVMPSVPTSATTATDATPDAFETPVDNSGPVYPLNFSNESNEPNRTESQHDIGGSEHPFDDGESDSRSISPPRDEETFRFREDRWGGGGVGDAQRNPHFGVIGDRRPGTNFAQRDDETSRIVTIGNRVSRLGAGDERTPRFRERIDRTPEFVRNAGGSRVRRREATPRFRRRNEEAPGRFQRSSAENAPNHRSDRSTTDDSQSLSGFGGGSDFGSTFEAEQSDPAFGGDSDTPSETGQEASHTAHTDSNEWDISSDRANTTATNQSVEKSPEESNAKQEGVAGKQENGQAASGTVHTVNGEWDIPPDGAKNTATDQMVGKSAGGPNGKQKNAAEKKNVGKGPDGKQKGGAGKNNDETPKKK